MVLKLFFAAVITLLLAVPFLQVAGALLVGIAWKLFHGGPQAEGKRGARAGESA